MNTRQVFFKLKNFYDIKGLYVFAKKMKYIVTGVALILLAGCLPVSTTKTSTATAIPTPLPTPSLGNFCETFYGDRVSLSGYLYLPDKVTVEGDYTWVWLVKTSQYPVADSEQKLILEIKEGSQPNQMQPLQIFYELSDLKIKTDDGKFIGHGDYIQVSGIQIHPKFYNTCHFRVWEVFQASP